MFVKGNPFDPPQGYYFKPADIPHLLRLLGYCDVETTECEEIFCYQLDKLALVHSRFINDPPPKLVEVREKLEGLHKHAQRLAEVLMEIVKTAPQFRRSFAYLHGLGWFHSRPDELGTIRFGVTLHEYDNLVSHLGGFAEVTRKFQAIESQ